MTREEIIIEKLNDLCNSILVLATRAKVRDAGFAGDITTEIRKVILEIENREPESGGDNE